MMNRRKKKTSICLSWPRRLRRQLSWLTVVTTLFTRWILVGRQYWRFEVTRITDTRQSFDYFPTVSSQLFSCHPVLLQWWFTLILSRRSTYVYLDDHCLWQGNISETVRFDLAILCLVTKPNTNMLQFVGTTWKLFPIHTSSKYTSLIIISIYNCKYNLSLWTNHVSSVLRKPPQGSKL